MEEEFIETNEDGEELSESDIVKKLRTKLKESEEKAQEYLIGWQKERADIVNARKRDEEEKKNFAKFANENLIMEILPALDSFDMAIGSKEANKEDWEKLPENWRKGMEYVHSQLISALESQGVKRIYPLHQDFSPIEHDAIATISTEKDSENNKVLEVIQPGYSLNGKMIRTAKVKVGELTGL